MVVYMTTCRWKVYIGKTMREMRRQVGEHLGYFRHKRDTPVGYHIWECQNGDPKNFTFMAIDRVQPTARKGDLNKILLQRETFWIYKRFRRSSPLD